MFCVGICLGENIRFKEIEIFPVNVGPRLQNYVTSQSVKLGEGKTPKTAPPYAANGNPSQDFGTCINVGQ